MKYSLVYIGMLYSLLSTGSAVAGFDWKGFATDIVKEVLKPAPESQPSPSSQPTAPTRSDTPSNRTVQADSSTCDIPANWLEASIYELESSREGITVAVDKTSDGKQISKQVSSIARILDDSLFVPAFGKPYDQLSDHELRKYYAALTDNGQWRVEQGKRVKVESACQEALRSRNTRLQSFVRHAGLLFDKNRQPDFIKVVSEMREAKSRISAIQAEIDGLDNSDNSRARYNNIKNESAYWIGLSMVNERKNLESRLAEAGKRFPPETAELARADSQTADSLVYTGPKRFSARLPAKSPDYASKVPLFNQKAGSGLAMGGGISRTEGVKLYKAGLGPMACQYGPFKGAEGGYTVLYFWDKKRPMLSPAAVQHAIADDMTSDIALPVCPSTFGEGLAYLYGIKEPPSSEVLAARQEQVKKSGQRFATKFALRTDFANTDFTLERSDLVGMTNLANLNNGRSWFKDASKEVDRLQTTGQRLLQCSYVAGKGERQASITVHFWSERKPVLIGDTFGYWVEQMENYALVDVVAKECPEYLGEAVALSQATGANEALAKAKEAAKHADANPLKPMKERNDWYAGAAANSSKTDTALAKDIDKDISILESGIGQLTWQSFNGTVKTSIGPKLLSLARSGYAQLGQIQNSSQGRATFEKWDQQSAGQVMRSILRLERVIAKKTTERLRWSDAVKNERQRGIEQSEREAWSYNANIKFTKPIYDFFMPKYIERLENHGTLDPQFMAMVRQGIPHEQSAAAARANVAGTNSRPIVTETTKTTIVFGTPSQIAVWKMANSMGESAGKAVRAWGQFQGSIDDLDRQIKSARNKFWECYATRCNDAARVYLDYSTLLYWKDWHYMVTPVLNRKSSQAVGDNVGITSTLYKMGGADQVDDGVIPGCESERSSFEAEVDSVLSGWTGLGSGASINTYKEKLDSAFTGSKYANWQQCRDKMEFMLRPRKF